MLLLILAAVAAWLYFAHHGHAAAQPGTAPMQSGPPLSAYDSGPSPLDQMSQAIYQFEGGQPGNVNFDNDNPGNLRSAPGETGTNRGFATFGNFSDGWQVLQSYISRLTAANPNWDFYDFFQHYLGQNLGGPASTSQGNSDAYAEYVANHAGVDPSTPVSSFLQGGLGNG